jgi:hypothetical protein
LKNRYEKNCSESNWSPILALVRKQTLIDLIMKYYALKIGPYTIYCALEINFNKNLKPIMGKVQVGFIKTYLSAAKSSVQHYQYRSLMILAKKKSRLMFAQVDIFLFR